MDDPIKKYIQLSKECDSMSDRLSRLHKGHIQCRKGCCDCCVNLTVFPVEFYFILGELKKSGIKPDFDKNASCGYLKDGLCVIYKYRPIICRTHGLPIVFLDDNEEPPRNCVSFCELNFTDIDDDYGFDQFTTLNIDSINERLFSINLEFISQNRDMGFEPVSRMELAALREFLQ